MERTRSFLKRSRPDQDSVFRGIDLSNQPYLTKRGKKTNYLVKRVFLVLDGYLFYFKSCTSSEPSGVIPLTNSEYFVHSYASTDQLSNFCVEIRSPARAWGALILHYHGCHSSKLKEIQTQMEESGSKRRALAHFRTAAAKQQQQHPATKPRSTSSLFRVSEEIQSDFQTVDSSYVSGGADQVDLGGCHGENLNLCQHHDSDNDNDKEQQDKEEHMMDHEDDNGLDEEGDNVFQNYISRPKSPRSPVSDGLKKLRQWEMDMGLGFRHLGSSGNLPVRTVSFNEDHLTRSSTSTSTATSILSSPTSAAASEDQGISPELCHEICVSGLAEPGVMNRSSHSSNPCDEQPPGRRERERSRSGMHHEGKKQVVKIRRSTYVEIVPAYVRRSSNNHGSLSSSSKKSSAASRSSSYGHDGTPSRRRTVSFPGIRSHARRNSSSFATGRRLNSMLSDNHRHALAKVKEYIAKEQLVQQFDAIKNKLQAVLERSRMGLVELNKPLLSPVQAISSTSFQALAQPTALYSRHIDFNMGPRRYLPFPPPVYQDESIRLVPVINVIHDDGPLVFQSCDPAPPGTLVRARSSTTAVVVATPPCIVTTTDRNAAATAALVAPKTPSTPTKAKLIGGADRAFPPFDASRRRTSLRGNGTESGSPINTNKRSPMKRINASGAVSPTRNGGSTRDQKVNDVRIVQATSLAESYSGGYLLRKYEPIKMIGCGGFGHVMVARHKQSGQLVAIKSLSKKAIAIQNQVEHTKAERQVLLVCRNHPFIIQIHAAFQTIDHLHIVLEYCSGGELFFHLSRFGRFDEYQAAFYTGEVLLALEHLHRNSIIYRDLKPENVLLDKHGHVRLADFGLSKQGMDDSSLTRTFCGSLEYLAPEVLALGDRSMTPPIKGYNKAIDYWALGCMLYELLTGEPPFDSSGNPAQLCRKITRTTIRFPAHVSREAMDLVHGLLQPDPDKRLGSGPHGAAIIKAHPYFRKHINWDKLAQRKMRVPFLPSRGDFVNFDKKFTSMPVGVVDKMAAFPPKIPIDYQLFDNFNWESK